MKSDLKIISTKDMSKQDWLDFRSNGIGGSEVGVVMGVSPYKSALELFYEKLNPVKELEENEAMHWGKVLEDVVADHWQYWQHGVEEPVKQMMKNFDEEKIIRRCRRMNAYIINPKYPFLFSSLDRVINKHCSSFGMSEETAMLDEGVLEIKTISGYVSKMWDTGIPPSHVMQLQTYLLVTELSYGEMALLKDGRYMEVVPFQQSETIHQMIVKKCSDFWDKVLAAREVLKQAGVKYYNDLDGIQNKMQFRALIDQIEPEPDGSIAYQDFMSTRFTSEPLTVIAEEQHINDAQRYMIYNEQMKVLEANQRLVSNRLKNYMKEAEVLDCGAMGKATWKTNSKGSRTFLVKVKMPTEKPTEQNAIEAIRSTESEQTIKPLSEPEILLPESSNQS